MPIPTPMVLLLYYALIFSLALIVRWAHFHYRDDGPRLKQKDLEREFRIPYTPPPDRRKRSFDWSAER